MGYWFIDIKDLAHKGGGGYTWAMKKSLLAAFFSMIIIGGFSLILYRIGLSIVISPLVQSPESVSNPIETQDAEVDTLALQTIEWNRFSAHRVGVQFKVPIDWQATPSQSRLPVDQFGEVVESWSFQGSQDQRTADFLAIEVSNSSMTAALTNCTALPAECEVIENNDRSIASVEALEVFGPNQALLFSRNNYLFIFIVSNTINIQTRQEILNSIEF